LKKNDVEVGAGAIQPPAWAGIRYLAWKSDECFLCKEVSLVNSLLILTMDVQFKNFKLHTRQINWQDTQRN
jgi:hypothetical protein